MSFKDSYPDYIAIEEHIHRARVERSLALAQLIADLTVNGIRGMKRLARILGAKRAGAVPQWARPAPLNLPRLPAEG